MPVIEVKLYDRRVTEESVPKMIEALTNALHESSGAAIEHIQVIIQGVPPQPLGPGRQAERVRRSRSLEADSWRLRDRRGDEVELDRARRPGRSPASRARGAASCGR